MEYKRVFGSGRAYDMLRHGENKYLKQIEEYKENIINPDDKKPYKTPDNISNITLRYFNLLLYDNLMKKKIEYEHELDDETTIINNAVNEFSVMVDSINALHKMSKNPINPNIVYSLSKDIGRIKKYVEKTSEGSILKYDINYPRMRNQLIQELDSKLHNTSQYNDIHYNIPSKNNMYKKRVNTNVEYNIYKTIKKKQNKKRLSRKNYTSKRDEIKLDEFDSPYVSNILYKYNLDSDYINTEYKTYIKEYNEYINQCIAIDRLNKNAIRTVNELNEYIVDDIRMKNRYLLRYDLIMKKREGDLYKKDLTELQCKAINNFLKEIRIMYDKYELLMRKHLVFKSNPFREVFTWEFDELSEYFRYNNHTLLLQDYNATDKKYEFE